MEALMSVPLGFDKIYEILLNKKWIISIFNVEDKELYSPIEYVLNKQNHGVNYTLLIDTNIFSFITNSYKNESVKDIHRAAIALIVFCQIAEINIDINLPIFEKVDFDKNNLNASIKYQKLFFRIDDSLDIESLIDFSLGERNDYIINEEKNVSKNVNRVKKWFDNYETLEEWDSTYLIVLKLVELNLLNITNKKKFSSFMNWQFLEFRFSMIGIFYGLIMFSSIRVKGMMKYKISSTREEKRKQINNMTWDLYFMNQFYRKLRNKTEKEEFLIATDDKVIQFLMRVLIKVNESLSMHTMKDFLNNQDFDLLKIYDRVILRKDERKFKNVVFQSDNHRKNLIKDLELVLLY